MANNTRLLGGNSNPYASEAVVADTMPIVDYFIKQKAHQAALDEAATKHALDKINDFDAKSIRAVDTPELLGITDKYRNHYIGNQKAINNTSLDAGKSYLDSKGFHSQGILHSAKSKAAAAEDKLVAELKLADTKAGRDTDHDNVVLMERMAAPVTSPLHYKDGAAMTQPYTSADWKPYQAYDDVAMAKQLKNYDNIFNNNDAFEADGASKTSVDGQTGKKITIDPFRLSAKGMDDIKSVFNADYAGNPSVQTHAKDAYKTISNEVLSTGTSPTLSNLNKTYKEFVGKDLDPTNQKEIGLAQLLSKKSSQLKGIEYNDAGTVDNHYAHKVFDANFDNNKKFEAYKLQPHKYPLGTEIKSDGNVYQPDGKTPYTGFIQVPIEKVSQQAIKDIRSGSTEDAKGKKITYDIPAALKASGDVPVYVENGKPQYIGTEESSKKIGGYFPLVPNKKGKIQLGNTTSHTSSSTQQTGKSSTVTYVDGGVTYNIPADKEASFLKAKPKAKKQ